MGVLQIDTNKPLSIWRRFFAENRQLFIKLIADWLVRDRCEYVSFVILRKDGAFAFVPFFFTKDALAVWYLFNSFSTLEQFRQGFELARNFVNWSQLLHMWFVRYPTQKPVRFEFVSPLEYRRRHKKRGVAFSALLDFIRPVEFKL